MQQLVEFIIVVNSAMGRGTSPAIWRVELERQVQAVAFLLPASPSAQWDAQMPLSPWKKEKPSAKKDEAELPWEESPRANGYCTKISACSGGRTGQRWGLEVSRLVWLGMAWATLDSAGQDRALRTSVLILGVVAAAHLWFSLFGLPARCEGFDGSLPRAKRPRQPSCQPQETEAALGAE